jgi:hypothetical protein
MDGHNRLKKYPTKENLKSLECQLLLSDCRSASFVGDLTPSQFPVFTIYVQKNCLKSAAKCASAWSFERVSDYGLTATEISKSQQDSRAACMDTCLNDDACRYKFLFFNCLAIYSPVVLIIA